jgi:hypothetical protein
MRSRFCILILEDRNQSALLTPTTFSVPYPNPAKGVMTVKSWSQLLLQPFSHRFLSQGWSVKTLAPQALVFGSLLLATATCAQAQVAPERVSLNTRSPLVELTGQGGGSKREPNCAGFIAEKPNYLVEVTEDSDRRFRLEGAVDSTLLIVNAKGQKFCVKADKLSAGKVEIPGRWSKGLYQVFVGSQTQARSTYKLKIEPIN